jgi:hypothetical protein
MIQLAQSSGLRKQLGEAGRDRVEREYSYDGLAERLVALFQTFAARAGRSSLREQLNQPKEVLCEPCPA